MLFAKLSMESKKSGLKLGIHTTYVELYTQCYKNLCQEPISVEGGDACYTCTSSGTVTHDI